MKDQINNADVTHQVNTILDQADDRLDPDTLRRLKGMRLRALAARTERPFYKKPFFAVPAMAAVVGSILFALLFHPMDHPSRSLSAEAEDMDIITAQEELDFYADLEFYDFISEVQSRG